MKDRIVLIGCGKVGKEALAYYGKESVLFFCDNYYESEQYEGILVKRISELKNEDGYRIVIAIRKNEALRSITRQLGEMGLKFSFFDDEYYSNNLSNQAVFEEIYRNNCWGGDEGEFYSGSGSHDSSVVEPYIEALCGVIKKRGISSITEIGCGDYYIMNRVLKNNNGVKYCGIDIVDKLIRHNNSKYGNERVTFVVGDACDSDFTIPIADLLIVRQVFQHLDNASITKILAKANAFKYELITEHISIDSKTRPNLDIKTGAGTRLRHNSGVFIELPPFSIHNVEHILFVPSDGGIIRSSLVAN